MESHLSKMNNTNAMKILMLRGKLVDLAVSQVINTDVMKMMYQEVTNEVFVLAL